MRAIINSLIRGEFMFNIGDKVVYPGHGIGEIRQVVARSIEGEKHTFLEIELQDGKHTKLMVPENRACEVGLRHPLSRDSLSKVYEILREPRPNVKPSTWNRRYRDYSQKLRSGSLFDIAEVLRDLSGIRVGKELSFGERKILENARSLLVSEIAVIKRDSEAVVEYEIDELLIH
jgi:CarD family transcriptional regulator